MRDKEFNEKVYEKYENLKDVKNDEFFNKHHYKKSSLKFQKLVASLFIAIIGTSALLISSLSVYAALGGTIGGKPVFDWIGIAFPNEYNEYVEQVTDEKKITHDKTEINLISTMCDEGITVLEFDIILSEEDKLKLGLDEMPKVKKHFTDEDYVTDESIQSSISVIFNDEPMELNNSISHSLNNFTVYIDGEKYWIRPRGTQSVKKISNCEYKVYQMYFLTDKELAGKTDFTMTLKDIVITRGIEINSADLNSVSTYLFELPQEYIEVDGEINIDLSKKKVLENTTILTDIDKQMSYKKMTKSVDKITLTPMQTIIKIESVITDVSLRSISSTRHEDYIGIIEYEVYDENGNELTSSSYETRRTVKYANGNVEEWEQGDIGTWKSFYNATMELSEFLIVEKTNAKILRIAPYIRDDVTSTRQYLQEISINL